MIKAIELKFLLLLLGQFDQGEYRMPITKLQLNKQTRQAERDRLCRELNDRGLVGYRHEVTQFKISAAGKTVLQSESTGLPLSEQQLSALRACGDQSISPGNLKLPLEERQPLIQDLVTKGLMTATKIQIKEVWLTPQGLDYLRTDCAPTGTATISFNLLHNYLAFLRRAAPSAPTSTAASPTTASSTAPSAPSTDEVPSDDEIVQLIQDLDRHHNTSNYLPIVYLRQKLQPSLSREDLDRVLYRLQSQGRIELSTLQESNLYADHQDAGIPQPVGGPLFFIEVLD